jgi:5'-nucleotidase
VNGTPADCVKIAVKHILAKRPHIIVSGINQCSNTATNIIYSGTVSAAAEGVIQNIPSIAVSLTSFKSQDFAYSAKISRKIAVMVLEKGLPDRTVLNVNVPAIPEQQIEDIVIARQGLGRYEEVFDKRIDPQNRTYFWLTGKKMILDKDNDVDDVVVMQNKVSITPIQYDLTHYKFLKELRKWNLKP